MSKEIKIGLIGAGWMGKAHTTAFHNARMIFGDDMPVFELVSDVSEDAVAKFAKNMGYNRYTTNWMDVVTDPEIDLVDVATPNCMHYEMAKAALEHGKHVFCEKPLSLSAEQSRELADLAKEKGVVNYCGFSNIMNPANQYVAELVKSGKLGKIMRVHATYDQDMLLDPSIPIAWRHINKLAGSGALGDLCSHLLSVSQMIMGDMSEVLGVQSIVIPERPVKAGSTEMGKVENDDLITFVKDRLGHDQRYGIDPSKIKADLGWYPETSFEVGIVKTIRWNLEHRDWVETVSGSDYQQYYDKMYGGR